MTRAGGLQRVASLCQVSTTESGPSDHPDFADWLVDEGIKSISLNPDSVIATWQRLASR